MTSGSFMPPEPLPNSVKAKQIEQQEMASQQAESAAGPGDPMMQMQKAQEDAVNHHSKHSNNWRKLRRNYKMFRCKVSSRCIKFRWTLSSK